MLLPVNARAASAIRGSMVNGKSNTPTGAPAPPPPNATQAVPVSRYRAPVSVAAYRRPGVPAAGRDAAAPYRGLADPAAVSRSVIAPGTSTLPGNVESPNEDGN